MSDAGNPMAAGNFVWTELNTPDPEAAKAFFAGVLGWTFTSKDMGPMGVYTIIQNGDRQIGGMMKMEGAMWDGIPPHWMSYIAVDDVDAAAGKVESLGGKVCVPPSDIPEVGRFCVINDPTGAVVSLITFLPMGG